MTRKIADPVSELEEKLEGIGLFLDEIDVLAKYISTNPTKQEMSASAAVITNLVFTIKGIIQ